MAHTETDLEITVDWLERHAQGKIQCRRYRDSRSY